RRNGSRSKAHCNHKLGHAQTVGEFQRKPDERGKIGHILQSRVPSRQLVRRGGSEVSQFGRSDMVQQQARADVGRARMRAAFKRTPAQAQLTASGTAALVEFYREGLQSAD